MTCNAAVVDDTRGFFAAILSEGVAGGGGGTPYRNCARKEVAPGSFVSRSLSRRVDIHKGAFASRFASATHRVTVTFISTLTSATERSCRIITALMTYRFIPAISNTLTSAMKHPCC